MYGFGGVGQLEVRFGQVLPQRDKRPKKERQGYSANGPWKAEMSKKCTFFNSFSFLGKEKSSTHRSQSQKKFNLSPPHLFHRIQTIGFGSFSLKNFKLFGNSTYQHFDSFSSPTQWSSGFNVMLGNFPFQTYTLNKNLMCSYSLHLFTQHL